MGIIMKLEASTLSYERFWDDQNKKLLAHPDFLESRGNLFDDVIYFKHRTVNSVTEINFSLFDYSHIKLGEGTALYIEGEKYFLTSKEYAKLFFIAALPEKNTYGITSIQQMIVHVFAFLNFQQSLALDSNNLENFWISFLGESVNERGFYNRLAAPSYNGTVKYIPFAKIRNKLRTIGVTGIIAPNITQKKIENILNEVCQSQLSITFKEYRTGGSFNFLGLELGQYYVDYLRLVYLQDYLYLVICKMTMKKISNIYGYRRDVDSCSYVVYLDVILSALTNQKIGNKKYKLKGMSRRTLYNEIQEIAYSCYKSQFEKAMSLNEKCIEELVLELDLGMRFDAVEVIRILMLQKFYNLDGHKSPDEVWNNYLASLDKSILDSKNLAAICVSEVYAKMESIVIAKKLEKKAFLSFLTSSGGKVLNQCLKPDYRSFKAELNNITHAMTTLVVAWLGYRKSELGFPLEAIKIEPNRDILDNSHVPFRFKLKWFVPKTNGKTKIDREITSQCYQIAVQIHELFNYSDRSPCLYESSEGNEGTNNSDMFIERRVKANWSGFVNHYQPFVDVLYLDTLKQKNKGLLQEKELQDLERLSFIYKLDSLKYKNLLTSAQTVRLDWERLSCTSFNSPKAQREFKKALERIIQTGNTDSSLHSGLIERYFSDKTKKLLRSGTVVLDIKAMNDIVNELLQGVNYPSSHALRHVWAEAVLTRYQGDVGTVIRHQFCHLDASFFMAYLRDKDARGLMKGASKRYLNSIVETLMLDTGKVGEEYIGGFARYVKKATGLTKPVSIDEFNELREGINSRVISIQPSHFALCIPRDGGEKRAKCAKFGNINPQDAKPEFCLNCTNAVITSGNMRGIWTTIQPMVKEALNENTKGFMLEAHLPTLRSGYKRIKQLQSPALHAGAVTKILEVIETAIKTIESKLQQESKIDG